jgi:hypothetical protein
MFPNLNSHSSAKPSGISTLAKHKFYSLLKTTIFLLYQRPITCIHPRAHHLV